MRLPDCVRPGDVLFERGSGFIAWAIKKLTKSQFSHVALVVDQDTVIEAWPGGVRKIPCPYFPDDYEIKTCQDLTDEQRQQLVQYAEKFIGTPYDYFRIIALLIELGLHVKNRIFKRGEVICSVFVGLDYKLGVGLDLRSDKPAYHLTPEDLYESDRLSGYTA